jgi:hypothetical protein
MSNLWKRVHYSTKTSEPELTSNDIVVSVNPSLKMKYIEQSDSAGGEPVKVKESGILEVEMDLNFGS